MPSHLVIFSKEGPDWLMTKALQSIAKNLQYVLVQIVIERLISGYII